MEVKVKVTQSSPTYCDPVDYTIHGILQARILEWIAFPFSRGSSQPRDRSQASHISGGFFTNWAIYILVYNILFYILNCYEYIFLKRRIIFYFPLYLPLFIAQCLIHNIYSINFSWIIAINFNYWKIKNFSWIIQLKYYTETISVFHQGKNYLELVNSQ